MLTELLIKDFAIIDHLALRFGAGLSSLTGETGAGKSIIIDALGAALGDRISSDVVRSGAKRATVDATFDLSDSPIRADVSAALDELGIDQEEGRLILSREVGAGGRGAARVNGRQVTVSALQRIGRLLVDIHGQSEHLSLLRADQQLLLLDRFADAVELRRAFAIAAGELRTLRARIVELESGARDRAQRADLLAFQANEIATAALERGEEEGLLAERRRLESTSRLVSDSSAALALLAGAETEEETPAISSLRRAAQIVRELTLIDEALGTLAGRLDEQLYLIEDAAAELRAYRDAIEPDPDRLEIVADRLDLIQRLKRKYGATIDEVIAFGEAAQRELELLTGGEGGVDSLRERHAERELEAGVLATRLSEARREAAERLSRGATETIAELRMGRAAIAIEIRQHPDESGIPLPDGRRVAFDTSGVDRVEFLLAANPGEVAKSLARVASGGETARIMLAIKSILAAADATPTLVFDEVDTGVGGRSGQVVGEKLWRLTDGHQVIVITHLPQIAAYGDNHYRIAKRDSGGRTSTEVVEIEGSDRLIELAEMLGGVDSSDAAVATAREMIAAADAWKASQHPERFRSTRPV